MRYRQDMGALIVIGGGTGSGKSALARALTAALAPALHLTEDDYYRCASTVPNFDAATFNFDDPATKDFDLLVTHLDALRAGEIVEAPKYDFARHMREADRVRVAPAPVLILEGLHALSDPNVRARADLTIFVDTPEEVRLARRLVRDVRERGRDIEGIVGQFLGTVRPMHLAHVEPQKALAHLVVDAERNPPQTLCEFVVSELRGRGLVS